MMTNDVCVSSFVHAAFVMPLSVGGRPVGIGIVGTWAYGNVRILWLHSVICWAESTFYLSLSMGRWVVNSRVGLPCSAGWMGGCTFDSVLDLDFRLGIFKLSTNLIPEQKGLKILFRLLLAKLLAELTKIGHIFRKCLSNQKVFWVKVCSLNVILFNVIDNFRLRKNDHEN